MQVFFRPVEVHMQQGLDTVWLNPLIFIDGETAAQRNSALPEGHSKSPPGSQTSSRWEADRPTQTVRESFASAGKDDTLRQLSNTDLIW